MDTFNLVIEFSKHTSSPPMTHNLCTEYLKFIVTMVFICPDTVFLVQLILLTVLKSVENRSLVFCMICVCQYTYSQETLTCVLLPPQ